MMRYSFLLLAIFLNGCPAYLFAQADPGDRDSAPFGKNLLLPALLVGTGTMLSGSNAELRLSEYTLRKVGHGDRYPVDNYLQFVPMAEWVAAGMLGASAKNPPKEQVRNFLLANAVNTAVVFSLKYGLNKTRPNGSSHSFPSGHTAFAFANATVLYEEYKSTHPVLAWSGYGVAVAVGGLRILNNRHWLSDVVAGAGIGILSTELVYRFRALHPAPAHRHPKGRKTSFILLPQTGGVEIVVGF